jgi:hypothetical protein
MAKYDRIEELIPTQSQLMKYAITGVKRWSGLRRGKNRWTTQNGTGTNKPRR